MGYLQNKPLTLCGPSTEHWDPTLWDVYWRLQLLPLTLCVFVFTEGSNGYNPLDLLCMRGLYTDDSSCPLYLQCVDNTADSNYHAPSAGYGSWVVYLKYQLQPLTLREFSTEADSDWLPPLTQCWLSNEDSKCYLHPMRAIYWR